MTLSRRVVLENLSIGSRVAEDEVDQLASYFVETDQWRRVFAGDVDVVFGAKGAGKSAIYASLVNRADVLFDRGILLVSGENPRGALAFKDLVADPPASEAEFVGLWKLFILALIAGVVSDYELNSSEAGELLDTLSEAGLFSRERRGLGSVVRRALDYARGVLRWESVEGGVKTDPVTGSPIGYSGKITFREPSDRQRAEGFVSADALMSLANEALAADDLEVWVLFDRLDVAFAETRDLEANALRALFKVYLDTLQLERLNLKIFLRTDIWRAVTEGGFREASHITRTLDIDWNEGSLLNLLVRRLLQNPDLVTLYGIDAEAVMGDSAEQRVFFDRLVPDKVDSGRNPDTYEWMLGRVRDGTGRVAPRELIHLASRTRDVQVGMIERGDPEPPGENLFARQAFRDALPEVSRVRLEQTLFAEYPELKGRLMALEDAKTQQSVESLAAIWQVEPEEALAIALHLVDVGFFERRGSRADPDLWVPFLYRPALNLVQGTAE